MGVTMASTKLRCSDPVRRVRAKSKRTTRGVEFRCTSDHLLGIQTASGVLEIKCDCHEMAIVEMEEENPAT
jgi:hypothetical protein